MNTVPDRWLKARRAMKIEEQVYATRLAEMVRKHDTKGIIDDQLEAALFAVLVEILKEIDQQVKYSALSFILMQ